MKIACRRVLQREDREVELRDRHPPHAGRRVLAGSQLQQLRAPIVVVGAGAPARARLPHPSDCDGRRGADPEPEPYRRERAGARRENAAMGRLPPARWWTVRRAHNRKPATYRCPLCGHLLPALSEHMLIAPEGDTRRRRHAHTECVLAARKRGELAFEEEWRASRREGGGERASWPRRLLARLRGR